MCEWLRESVLQQHGFLLPMLAAGDEGVGPLKGLPELPAGLEGEAVGIVPGGGGFGGTWERHPR
jgi:hypothetical protein